MLAVTLHSESVHPGLWPASAENYKTKLLFVQESSKCSQRIIEILEMNCRLSKDKTFANFTVLSACHDVKLNNFPFGLPTRLKRTNFNSLSTPKRDFFKIMKARKRGL